ncbi:SCO2525 family SAM-dependent methyltransferase [Actinocorallia populi]|uniref:SCO2525 family SAM-dependent methyltransferase n=1 Tax=Actinocorallia populi TaxID=2079200 RepID=UPI0013002310|nr:SCO2525 family SAM-dependent methyltransferase [Actinocorallia populi]
MSVPTESGRNRPWGTGFNSDFEWNRLNPDAYFRKNYLIPHRNDLVFLAKVRDFFGEVLGWRRGLHGVDVGAGANLYPALAMLPFCDRLTLLDYSEANLAWLRRETQAYTGTWDPFWAVLDEAPAYAALTRPRLELRERSRVEFGSVFRLPGGHWDLGTLFFVAESISSSTAEFRLAVQGFLGALKPGAPFAAAFMENSRGWKVGQDAFPAVAVTASDVAAAVAGAENLEICRLDAGPNPVRAGYTGMILVCGQKAQART